MSSAVGVSVSMEYIVMVVLLSEYNMYYKHTCSNGLATHNPQCNVLIKQWDDCTDLLWLESRAELFALKGRSDTQLI